MHRSLLFIPGHKLRYIRSLKEFPDILVIDLEDSVPQNKKDIALQATQNFLEENYYDKGKIYVRITYNNKFIEKKYQKIVNKNLTGFILPKVQNKNDLKLLLKFVVKQEKLKKIKKKFRLSFIAETTNSIVNLNDIIKSTDRIDFIIYGEEDYHADLNSINFSEKLNNNYAKNFIPILAKSNDVQAIFTPYLYLKNLKGLKKHILDSVKLGYSGLLLIHPSQINLTNKLYMPSNKDLEIAKQILESNKTKKYEGQNISVLKNKLIGPPMIRRAQKIIDLYNKK